jgi:hypothetical protein
VTSNIEHVFDTESRFLDGPQAEVVTALSRQLDATPPGSDLTALLDTVDPHQVHPSERVALLRAAARQESWLFARRSAVLATMGELDREGRPLDDEDWAREDVATTLRVHPLSANSQLHAARHLVTHLPATFSAVASGALGVTSTKVLTELTSGLDREHAAEVEQRVLPRALAQTPGRLRSVTRREVAKVDPEAFADRVRAARQTKSISRNVFEDGVAELRIGLPSDDLTLVWGYLTRKAEEPVPVGDDRDKDTRRVDALLDLVRTALGGTPQAGAPAGSDARGSEPLLQVVIDLPDLLALRDRPATLVGAGPLPADLVRAWATDCDWQRLVRDPVSGHLLDLGTRRYRPSPELVRYLQMRDRTCRFPGCTQRARRCDLDHTVPHGAEGGATAACNLACLCRRHHRLKTFTDWHYQLHSDGSTTWIDPRGSRYREPAPDAHPDS